MGYSQALEASQSMEVGWLGGLPLEAGWLRLHRGAHESEFPLNQPDQPDQENIPKAAFVAVMWKPVHHSWGTWCCPVAKACHTVRSVDQTYWTSPDLPFFNQCDNDVTSGIAAMIALL